MINIKKFQKKLTCVCKNIVTFEVIPEIECDWGSHTVVQCPKCEELFSIDKKCPAFETIEKLWTQNMDFYDKQDQTYYLEKSHNSQKFHNTN